MIGKRFLAAAIVAGSAFCLHAQVPTSIPQIRFNAGQNVAPYFEGWIRNTDGSFDLVFGYFNRNYQEELVIPPGPDNKVEPGPPDQGQPTYFMPRRQRWTFRIRVPADFGKKSITWTVTAHGRTDKAYGELIPVQEITERIVMTNGGLDPGDDDPNAPPSITIAPITNAVAGTAVPLVASVMDDGLPKPRVPVAPRPAAPTAGQSTFGAQVNSSAGSGRPRGLVVSWMEYRGPAKVRFDTAGPTAVTNGQVTTRATFAEAGTYRLAATASDGALSKKAEITVVVKDDPMNKVPR